MFLPLERLPLCGGCPTRLLSAPQDCFDKDARYGGCTFQGAGQMTGILETPGLGHNTEGAEKENQHWERWAKKRTFVRALEGTYSHLYKSLIDQPRVFSSKDVPWKGGPGHYGKSVISPQAVNITQSIESHIEAYAPTASGQKHGHLNSAV